MNTIVFILQRVAEIVKLLVTPPKKEHAMGNKAIVIMDMDHLDAMDNDPRAFVECLKREILSHQRTGGDVQAEGTSVAHVVWSGLVSQTPVLEFADFGAKPVTVASAKSVIAEQERQAAYALFQLSNSCS